MQDDSIKQWLDQKIKEKEQELENLKKINQSLSQNKVENTPSLSNNPNLSSDPSTVSPTVNLEALYGTSNSSNSATMPSQSADNASQQPPISPDGTQINQ